MNAHWRRWRRRTVGRPRRQAVDATVPTLVLSVVVGALLTATTGFWAFAALEQFGPSVGALIAFKPSIQATDWWQIVASVGDPAHVDGLDAPAGRTCVLNPGTMAAGRGSIVIEARRLSRPPVYRVHWAGSHTSQGAADCGATADLVLSRSELMRLANVAGGFSNGLRLIGP